MSYFYFPENLNKSIALPYQVVELGYKFSQLSTSRLSGLSDYQLVYCISGKGIFKLGNEEHEIGPGMGFFTAPWIPQEYYATEPNWIVHYILFNGFGVEPYIKAMKIPDCQIFHIPNSFYIEHYFSSLYDCIKIRKSNWKTESSVILYALMSLFQLVENYENTLRIDLPAGKLLPVIHYIEKHYAEPISLQDIADVINISSSYCCQLFKKIYKTSPVDYMNNLRIEKAKNLLLTNDFMPIQKICELVGFSDPSYFCRIFKKQTGITPSEFRENSCS